MIFCLAAKNRKIALWIFTNPVRWQRQKSGRKNHLSALQYISLQSDFTKMAKLVLVPTPIGNLGDITLRALEVLKSADVLLAEDTRESYKLLKHFEIDKKLMAYHAHNEHQKTDYYISLIEQNNLVALLSDAGTPAISDPGFMLVRACIENNISVECLPGATAFVPALVVSGFPLHRFSFFGFPPHKKGRQKFFAELLSENKTVAFYESPHRLVKSLETLHELLNESQEICVVKEISKLFETAYRGTACELLEVFKTEKIRGEFVVVVNLLGSENKSNQENNS